MRSTEMRHPAAAIPVGAVLDLLHYGIDVAVSEVVCIDLQPVPQVSAEPVPTLGCEVIELPTEVVTSESLVTDDWRESVPARCCSPLVLKKELAHGYLASA